MSKSIQALRERKNEIARVCNQMLADKGEQVWTKEDHTLFSAKADEMELVDNQIQAHQRMIDAMADNVLPKKKDSAEIQDQTRAVVELFMRKGDKKLTGEEAELVRNTMSTSTGSQGGYTVPTLVASDYVDAQKDYGAMRRAGSRLVTSGGNDLSYPTTDGTAEVGEIVAQNTTAAASDPSFGTVPLNTQKYSSKIIAIPFELLQDTTIDILALLYRRMNDRIGRIQNLKFTQGSGTAEPWGLATAVTVGKTGTTGQTLTVIYDDLVDMVDSVDVAYQSEGQLSWMFGQTMRRVVRKLKDGNGRPIWTPSYDEGGSAATPDRLLGYGVNINNDMPVPGANNVSMTFGQHKKYMVRDAMEITLFRFDDSVYVTKGQIGFLAWARSGGNLLDTAAVKGYKHSAT